MNPALENALRTLEENEQDTYTPPRATPRSRTRKLLKPAPPTTPKPAPKKAR